MSYQPLEDVSSTPKVCNYIQILYYNSTKYFKWQLVHLEKYLGGIWRDMQQNRYLQDCTHLEYDFFIYKADLCSHDMYLQDEKNLKEIGWVMSMLWEIPHFMTWACLWSNLRLFMHRYTCALDVKFLISQEPPNRIWVGFFYLKGIICCHIPSICSWILGKIWVQNAKSTVER